MSSSPLLPQLPLGFKKATSFALIAVLLFATKLSTSSAFQPAVVAVPTPSLSSSSCESSIPLFMASTVPPKKHKKKGYDPKWKKKKTLAEQEAELAAGEAGIRDLTKVGIKGDVKVVFQQGNVTKTTMAMAGQPLRDVASQAGQFIKYGCGKGECGTCECLVNGKWIRPCNTAVPADVLPGVDYVVQVKDVKNKSKSSGKFYSARSFVMGFYNNLLGMVGFVKSRRSAKKNWDERKEYEELIKRKTLEKKMMREQQELLRQQEEARGSRNNKNQGGPFQP